MTRIVQIRRGTATENDNFTGLMGEVTMDTTNKTLRVHDGQTLGGTKLARLDQINNNFDIASVSDAFWHSLFARMIPHIPQFQDSQSVAITNNAYIETIMDIAQNAQMAIPVLICTNPDAGYNTGDEVISWGIGSGGASHPNIFTDTNGLHVRLYVGAQNLWVSHRDTGARTNIDTSKWRIKFRVCY